MIICTVKHIDLKITIFNKHDLSLLLIPPVQYNLQICVHLHIWYSCKEAINRQLLLQRIKGLWCLELKPNSKAFGEKHTSQGGEGCEGSHLQSQHSKG